MSIDTSIANSIPMTDEASDAFAGFVDFLNEELDHPERVNMRMNMDRSAELVFYSVTITHGHDSIIVYITDEGKTTMVVHDPRGGIRVIHTGEFINRVNHMTSEK